MLWQVPSLGLTAQAFLLTISLSPGTGALARVASSALAALAALMSMQLMAKHRHHELVDSRLLESIEIRLEFPIAPHAHPTERATAAAVEVVAPGGWWTKLSSYRVWMTGLSAFATVSAGTLVNALLDLAS